MNRFSVVILTVVGCWSLCAYPQENRTLTVTTWGGSYEEAQLKAYIRPFEIETGIEIVLKEYNGGVEPLRQQSSSNKLRWDVLDMEESDALAACEHDLLEPFDARSLRASPDGTPALEDFMDDAHLECGVAHIAYSTVLAYNDRAFPDVKPDSIADFFDIERFPGKRGLRQKPIAVLEWALLSYGVPVSQIYDLLSTERGINLALRRLNEIRDHIVWWESGSEPVELLKSDEVVMTSMFNGRFFDARFNHGMRISMIQDGQFIEASVWGISKNSPKRELAVQFIQFVTSTKSMKALAELLPFGPTRRSAMGRIGLASSANISMRDHIPTSPANLQTAIRADSHWYASTETIRKRRFEDWFNQGSEN